jgi:hypothetical protein
MTTWLHFILNNHLNITQAIYPILNNNLYNFKNSLKLLHNKSFLKVKKIQNIDVVILYILISFLLLNK